MTEEPFRRLREVIARLRAPNGCPWDREQTNESLVPALIEEAYEVAAAIRAQDDANLREELGDLLLVALMHAQIAQESGRFEIDDSIRDATEKLIRRHPHVFGTSDARDSGAVLKQWDAIKRAEKNHSDAHYLADIPLTFPALMRAQKVQTKVARVNFEKALAISEKKLGDESYSLTGILDRLGLMLRREKNYGEAAPVLQRTLSIREKTLGARHSDVAPALDNLALNYFYDNKFAEAEPLFQRSLQIWTATQGPHSALVALALDNLGALYSAQQRFTEAEPLFRRALSIRERQDVESLSNLALIYQAQNDAKNADAYFQRALLIGEKSLGSDTIELGETLEAYATFLRGAGRIADAKKIAAKIQELKNAPKKEK